MFSVKKVLFSVFVLLGVITVAQADTLAAGAAYGGPTQTQAICYLFNAGTGPVSIASHVIIREPNISLGLSADSCAAVLAPGASCGIAAPIVNFLAHSCRMIVSPSGADVRGSFEFRDSTGRVLNNLELR